MKKITLLVGLGLLVALAPVKASGQESQINRNCLFEQGFPAQASEVSGRLESNYYRDIFTNPVTSLAPFTLCGQPPAQALSETQQSPAQQISTPLNVAAGQVAVCPYQDLVPQVAGEVTARISMLCLINHDRSLAEIARLESGSFNRVKALRVNRRLRNVGQRYAKRMVVEQFFSHVGPEGQPLIIRVRRSGYLKGVYIWLIGENLAWGSGLLGSPSRINSAFLASPAHKKILNDYRFRDIGIGVVPGNPFAGATGATWALVFGRREYR